MLPVTPAPRPPTSGPGATGLSEQLCFDLYAASRAVISAYRPLLRELGLTYPQYLVLTVLWEHGSSTVRAIGDALRLDYGTLTPLLRRMEAQGLVTRRRGASDERFVEVALTESGDALRAHVAPAQCQVRELLGLDDVQITQLQTTLRLLAARATS